MLILFLKIGKYSIDLYYYVYMVICIIYFVNNKVIIEFRNFDVKDVVVYWDM